MASRCSAGSRPPGPRTAEAPGEYALVVEAVREGYLLHYAPASPGSCATPTATSRCSAGDYLYALGLERLAALGDLSAVRELSDLISLAAQLHDGSRAAERAEREATALWLGCATAIAAGPGSAHERAKAELRDGRRGRGRGSDRRGDRGRRGGRARATRLSGLPLD